MKMRWVRAAGSNGHVDAADMEDPEIRDEITNPRVYVRCCTVQVACDLNYSTTKLLCFPQSNYMFSFLLALKTDIGFIWARSDFLCSDKEPNKNIDMVRTVCGV